MRCQSSVTAAAWAAVALYFLPLGFPPICNLQAEEARPQSEVTSEVIPGVTVVSGFPSSVAPAQFVPAQFVPDGGPGPAWSYSPYGWQHNYETPMWPPRYRSGAWPQRYGRQYDGPQNFGPQYFARPYTGSPYSGFEATPPPASVRRPRSTRPYWSGPRWQPRGSPYAGNNNGYRDRRNYRSRPQGSRPNGYSGEFGSGNDWYPVPRQRRRPPWPQPYGYADAR